MQSLFQTFLVSPRLPMHSLSQHNHPDSSKQINGIDLEAYLSPPHQSSQSCPHLYNSLGQTLLISHMNYKQQPLKASRTLTSSAPPAIVCLLTTQHTKMTLLKQILSLLKIIQWPLTALGRSLSPLAYLQYAKQPPLPIECNF